jgi:hypothetical protein
VIRVSSRSPIEVTPSAGRLTSSLRDIGYDFNSAVADLVDNSVSANARRIDIEIAFEERDSYVLIADDGVGMSEESITEAMRFGTRRGYSETELGKYGLGLKTASLSQCRRLTVVTRTAPSKRRIRMRTLDLDHVEATDRWEVHGGPPDYRAAWAGQVHEIMSRGPGTVIVWDQLDRLFPESGPSGGWAKRRLASLTDGLKLHLGMVFHRFLEGTAQSMAGEQLVVTLNGEKVRPWNPFAPGEAETVALTVRHFELDVSGEGAVIRFSPFVLPARSLFSSQDEFDRLSGPRKWNRQQGLYIYRVDRLVQSGGWSGLRAIDEHTKLARAAVDFGPALDDVFRINVAKMRVSLPADVRVLLEAEVGVLCKRAQAMYRRDLRTAGGENVRVRDVVTASNGSADFKRVSSSLLAAAIATGTSKELLRVIDHLRSSDPELVNQLGW